MNRTLCATALALTVSLFAAGDASADTRSWTAVKKVIGKGDSIVVGIDLAQLRSTTAFQTGLQLFLSEEEEARTVFDTIKAECSIDVTTAVSDMTFVMQDDGDRPLIAFGLDGIDEPKVINCMSTVAAKMVGGGPAPKITGKKIGKVTEYSVKGEKKKLYAAWLAKDVFVFTEDPNDRKRLEGRLKGKGALGDLAKHIGKTTTGAPFWFAVAMKEVEDGRTILGGYGKVELTGGSFKASGSIVLAKPDEATSMAAEGNAAIGEAKKEVAAMPELLKVLNTLTITAAGAEVRLGASIPDKDIGKLLPQLDKVF